MAARKLSDDEWEALDRFRFSAKDAGAFRNATVILMTEGGWSKFDIGKELGCSPATVDNVRKRYRESGLEGLRRQKPPGRASQATPAYRTALREAVQTPPQSLGVWIQRLVRQPVGQTSGEDDRDFVGG